MANIVRREPAALLRPDFDGLRRAMDRMFEDAFSRWPFDGAWGSATENGAIPVDIVEQDGSLVVRASLPGFSRDDVDVQLHDGALTISAQHDEDHEEQGERYYRRERRIGSVSRHLPLPTAADGDRVEAELKDGVLTVTIPTPEEARPKQIDIKSG